MTDTPTSIAEYLSGHRTGVLATQRGIRRIALRQETDEELTARLIREERVVLLLRPDRYFPATLEAR